MSVFKGYWSVRSGLPVPSRSTSQLIAVTGPRCARKALSCVSRGGWPFGLVTLWYGVYKVGPRHWVRALISTQRIADDLAQLDCPTLDIRRSGHRPCRRRVRPELGLIRAKRGRACDGLAVRNFLHPARDMA
jgi:hypothetical protein